MIVWSFGGRVQTAAIAILAVCLLYLFGPCVLPAAPAPLPRRTTPLLQTDPRPPALCTMVWGATSYRTEFRGDGTYVATPADSASWTGFWHVKKPDGQPRLCVKERLGEDSVWLEWGVPLWEAMTVGAKTQGGAEVRLSVPDTRPDS
jgi:hypothetical protein